MTTAPPSGDPSDRPADAGRMLRHAMDERWTGDLRDLALAADITYETMRTWRNGERAPTAKRAMRLDRAIGWVDGTTMRLWRNEGGKPELRGADQDPLEAEILDMDISAAAKESLIAQLRLTRDAIRAHGKTLEAEARKHA